jgi:hypothetical protein
VVRDFATAASRARDGDVDGVEISCQAATLIEQFWSPVLNQRTDRYGGAFENRMRLGLEILAAVRESVGDDYVVGIRMPGAEMLKGGLSPEDCVQVATRYAGSGLIDFISVVGGNAVDYQGEAKLWPTMWVPSAAYLPLAKAIRDEVADKVRIFHATRMTDAATAMHALKSGSVDMVGMTRAFLADPHHVNKLKAGKEEEIRPCVGAGYCVDRVIRGLDAFCVHNVATTREASIPQTVTPTAGPIKKVVIVGGGPAGMEAARISAGRGHRVVLFEAARELGGQLLLAAKATWKRDMAGITAWLAGQMERLGVDALQCVCGGCRHSVRAPRRRRGRHGRAPECRQIRRRRTRRCHLGRLGRPRSVWTRYPADRRKRIGAGHFMRGVRRRPRLERTPRHA